MGQEPVTFDPHDTTRDVLLEVLRHGPLPRTRIAHRLRLSAGSLTRLTKPLVSAGVLVEGEPVSDPFTRRPTRPLDVPGDAYRFAGVDVTDTEMWAVLTDMRAGVVRRAHAALDDRSPAGVTAAVAALVRALAGEDEVAAVGIALGGHVAPDGIVTSAAFLGWRTPVDLAAAVSERLGSPVVAGNDLACLTRAEQWFGVGRDGTDFAVITVGAGVGYGLVVHDRIVENVDTGYQLLGHHPLDPTGPRCPEGHAGCATAVLTTGALAAAGARATGRPTSYAELIGSAAAGPGPARDVVGHGAGLLGRLVAAVANISGVDRVLLTGEGIGLAEVARDDVLAATAAFRDPRARPVDVVIRPHDFHHWARGAAGLAVRWSVAGPGWLPVLRTAAG